LLSPTVRHVIAILLKIRLNLIYNNAHCFHLSVSKNGIKLSVVECNPFINDIKMLTVDENDKNENGLRIETIRNIFEFASKEEYKQMFCKAMSG